jgi:hypothetical protein
MLNLYIMFSYKTIVRSEDSGLKNRAS